MQKDRSGNGNNSVTSVTVDKISEESNEKISAIKIDMEGMEKEVLDGAKKTIEKYKPTLIVEVNNQETKNKLKNIRNLYGYKLIGRFSPHVTTLLLSKKRVSSLSKKMQSVWHKFLVPTFT